MPDDMSAIEAPTTPSAVDIALGGGPAMGGTPDPNAPSPMMQPPQVTPQQPTDQFPYPGSPAVPMDVTAAPTSDTIPAKQMPPIPEETQHHMNWIQRAISATANLLGGPITYRLEPAPDGSLKIAPEPSTQGEKWGRIAANALGGLATGLANARGPGGAANATAAGIQYGMNAPQQRLQQQEQHVDFQNKQLLAQANRMHLTQQMYAEAQKQRLTGMLMDDESANRLKEYTDLKSKHSGFTDFGVIDPKDPNATSKFDKEHPGALDAFLGKGDKTLIPIPEPDGKVHLVGYDKALDDQKTTEAEETPYIAYKPDTNEPYIATKTVDAGTHTRGELANNSLAVHKELIAQRNTWATTQEKLGKLNKTPKTDSYQETMSAASAARAQGDTAEADRLDKLARQQLGGAQTLKETGTATGAGVGGIGPQTQIADLIKPGAPFAPGTVDGTIAQKLADGSNVLGDFPRRMAKGAPTPYQYSAAAEAYSQAMYGLPWSETDIQQEKKFFSEKSAQGALDGIDKMIGRDGHPGYLDTVVDLAKKANIGPSAPINQAVLWAKTHLGDQAAKDYQTALGEVQRTLPSLIGNPLLGGSDSDMKLRQAKEMFGSNPTLGNLQSTAQILSNMMRGSVNSYASNNRYLQRRYGLQGPYAKQFGMPGAGGTPTPPPADPTGGGGTPNPPAPAALKGQPFDATLYQTQHPGKNVQDAVNRARQSGMNVSNLPKGVQ